MWLLWWGLYSFVFRVRLHVLEGMMLSCLVSGCFCGVGRVFFPGLTQRPSFYMSGPFFLCVCCSSTRPDPRHLSRPWAHRGTCLPKWSRPQDVRSRACRAPNRETGSAFWLSFLAWSVTSGPRSTPTTGLLSRTTLRDTSLESDSFCLLPPQRNASQNHLCSMHSAWAQSIVPPPCPQNHFA